MPGLWYSIDSKGQEDKKMFVISFRKTRKNAEMAKACVFAFAGMPDDTKTRYRVIICEDVETVKWACEAEGIKIAACYPF